MKNSKAKIKEVHLATTEKGEEIYWDMNSGVKRPQFFISTSNEKVGKLPLQALRPLLSSSTFTFYAPNVWF